MADPLFLADKTGYYADLLVAQYRTQPKARGMVSLLVKQAMIDDLAMQIMLAFSLDTAVGKQLDILGKYVGVSRNIGPGSRPPLFSFWGYSSTRDKSKYQGTWDPATDTPTIPAAASGNNGNWYVVSASGTSASPIATTWESGDIIFSNGSVWARETDDCGNGLTTYSDLAVNVQGVFWSYAAASRAFSALTDTSYRSLLKLQAIQNHSDNTLASVMPLLATFFPKAITLVDNLNMTATYYVWNTVPISPDLLASFLPRPMGVRLIIVIVTPSVGGSGMLTTETATPITTETALPLETE